LHPVATREVYTRPLPTTEFDYNATQFSRKGRFEMGIPENKAVVDRLNAVLEGGDLDELDELCTPDLVNHALVAGRQSLEDTKAFLRGGAASSTGGRKDSHRSRWVERWVVAEGDLVVEYGTREGSWPGGRFRGVEIAPGPFTREVAFMYRFVGGRIAERWAVRDDLGMMLQLGAIGGPARPV
jgi:ketosteroid isomerase-like protein